jgi:hypothetical protein
MTHPWLLSSINSECSCFAEICELWGGEFRIVAIMGGVYDSSDYGNDVLMWWFMEE